MFKKVKKVDFAVIDSVFPQKQPYAFRNVEINEYFKRLKNFESFTMHKMLPGSEAWFSHGYGVDYRTFKENKKGYLSHYATDDKKINFLHPNRNYQIKLAYSFFLAETYVLLPFYEKHEIPFIFVLYPGGSFGLNFSKSDLMLKTIFDSPYFRGVITTQQITKDYLVEKRLCPKKLISHIYGGYVQYRKENVKVKKYFKKQKDTFDIVFIAAKYSEKGKDKGYDTFIKVANILHREKENIRFHVVGGFDASTLDVSNLGSSIKFYGYRQPDFLSELYASMDIFLSPNRSANLYKGNFDGFPLGIDAGYCGVALFVADDLGMNQHYKEGREIITIDHSPKNISSIIVDYYNKPESLYELAQQGQKKTQKLFDIDLQTEQRLKVFEKHVNLIRKFS